MCLAAAPLQAMYGGLYSKDNVVLAGTHTHASPAGFLQYVLYSVTSLGFVRQSFDALVDGITEVGSPMLNYSPRAGATSTMGSMQHCHSCVCPVVWW